MHSNPEKGCKTKEKKGGEYAGRVNRKRNDPFHIFFFKLLQRLQKLQSLSLTYQSFLSDSYTIP
jgi:hypothetical protein